MLTGECNMHILLLSLCRIKFATGNSSFVCPGKSLVVYHVFIQVFIAHQIIVASSPKEPFLPIPLHKI